jgi:hypothetical protein
VCMQLAEAGHLDQLAAAFNTPEGYAVTAAPSMSRTTEAAAAPSAHCMLGRLPQQQQLLLPLLLLSCCYPGPTTAAAPPHTNTTSSRAIQQTSTAAPAVEAAPAAAAATAAAAAAAQQNNLGQTHAWSVCLFPRFPAGEAAACCCLDHGHGGALALVQGAVLWGRGARHLCVRAEADRQGTETWHSRTQHDTRGASQQLNGEGTPDRACARQGMSPTEHAPDRALQVSCQGNRQSKLATAPKQVASTMKCQLCLSVAPTAHAAALHPTLDRGCEVGGWGWAWLGLTRRGGGCCQASLTLCVRGNLILLSWNCLVLSRLQADAGTVAVLMICGGTSRQ